MLNKWLKKGRKLRKLKAELELKAEEERRLNQEREEESAQQAKVRKEERLEQERVAHQKAEEEKKAMATCDFCAISITLEDMTTVQAAKVTSATESDFCPSNLPSTFVPPEFDSGNPIAQIAVKRTLWRACVKENATKDWGLCDECAAELDKHE